MMLHFDSVGCTLLAVSVVFGIVNFHMERKAKAERQRIEELLTLLNSLNQNSRAMFSLMEEHQIDNNIKPRSH